jgi:hypothetical protein
MLYQQIPKIDPYRVIDAARLRAKAAGPAAQRGHRRGQLADAYTDIRSQPAGRSQCPLMTVQQTGQGTIGCCPLPLSGAAPGNHPESR